MTIFLFIDPEEQAVQLMAPAVSEDGRTKGKLRQILRPGDDFEGYTYDMLVRLGSGKHELTFPPPKAAPARARA